MVDSFYFESQLLHWHWRYLWNSYLHCVQSVIFRPRCTMCTLVFWLQCALCRVQSIMSSVRYACAQCNVQREGIVQIVQCVICIQLHLMSATLGWHPRPLMISQEHLHECRPDGRPTQICPLFQPLVTHFRGRHQLARNQIKFDSARHDMAPPEPPGRPGWWANSRHQIGQWIRWHQIETHIDDTSASSGKAQSCATVIPCGNCLARHQIKTCLDVFWPSLGLKILAAD